MSDGIKITGGADPEVAAAIAAVVDEVIRAEASRDTGEPNERAMSAWTQAAHLGGRPEIRPRSIAEEDAPGPPPAPQ